MPLRRIALVVAALPLIATASSSAAAQAVERVRVNDNRAPGGVKLSGALAIRMEVKLAMWYPDGESRPGVQIPAFAELGTAPRVPGPLIRAPGGTDVIVVLRNSLLNQTLTVHGLHARPAIAPAGQMFTDSIVIPAGTTQQVRFRLDRPGTYFYWATTNGRPFDRRGDDSQLNGAIVVDEPGERTPRDRIFVLSMWSDTVPVSSDSVRHRQRELSAINGVAWPAPERVQYQKGDIARWRVINASADAHPMHLHGFYYRVTRRGNGMADTVLVPTTATAAAAAAFPVQHTERVAGGGTYSATFVTDKLGAWLFHCEDPAHSEARAPLGYESRNVTRAVGGLATIVEVTPADDDTTWKLPPAQPPYPARRFRMLLRPNLGSTASLPIYGIALHELGLETPPPDTGQRIGPTLVLNRSEPVSVWVVNQLPEPASLTWGVEGESIFDGVPGVSGVKPIPLPRNAPQPKTPPPPPYAPLIAPNDSFEVRLQPPRVGTFAYHAVVSPSRQISAGIVGAVVVTEKNRYDAALNIPMVISSPSDSALAEHALLLNGSASPAPLELKRGGTFRVRAMAFVVGRPDVVLELRQQDTTFAAWRPVARDGIELAATERVSMPGRVSLATGQVRDFEFLPIRVGEYRLEARTPNGTVLAVQPIRVY
jgi:FtsP/CotA-like multicopper oxidase with cupredoxin domain